MESLEKIDLFKDISCSGQRGQDMQNRQERETIQKRTFTRWINIHLKRCEPPLEVQDLFSDVQDGRVLMALLEELSGCKMLYRFRPSTHRIFRLNNIAKVLNFLEDRNVKCKSIDASDVADGIPSAVLGLIWTIIVLFHIKKSTRSIKHIFSTNSTRSINGSRDTTPTNTSATNNNWDTFPFQRRRSSHTSKYRGTAIKTLLRWVQTCTSKYDLEVWDFGRSWKSGLAFLALIKSINPALVDIRTAMTKSPQENVEEAFCVAHSVLGIPPLLDLEDVTTRTPDEQSIITYVTQFLEYRQNHDEINGSELYTGSCGTNTFSPEGLHSSEKHPSIIETSLYTSEGSILSPSENSIKPNDVFRMDSIEGQNFVNTYPLKATKGQAYARSSVDVETLSLSSEEGVYMLSALDSEEEEAYQYILALDEEANEAQRSNILEFQPVITADEHHLVVNTCQCREEMGSNNRKECISGFQQMTPITLSEVALAKNQHANTDHNGFVSVPPMDEICGQKVTSELIMASENNLQTDREGCAQEDSYTAVETSKQREYLAHRTEGNEIREGLSTRLESHDLGDDPLNAKDLCNNDVTNSKHINQEDQHSQWVETCQMDNCSLSHNSDKDSNSEQTSQTQVELSLQEEVEGMGEREMCAIQGANGKTLERESRMDHSIEGKEDLVEWDKHKLLSSQDITEVNADPTREGALFSGSVETNCSIDPEELYMLTWLWVLTYCLFILPQLNIC